MICWIFRVGNNPRFVGYSGWETPHDLLNIQGWKHPKVRWIFRVENNPGSVGYSGSKTTQDLLNIQGGKQPRIC
jgi:hypothetical protein